MTREYEPVIKKLHEEVAAQNRAFGHMKNGTMEEQEKEFGHLVEENSIDQSVERAPEVTSFVYKNMDAGTFGKIKKLKALSRSDNEEEAFMAWSKCDALCKKYDLKFDDIPS